MAYQLVSSAMGTFLALFPITNPVGVVPIFYSLAALESPRTRGRQARQVALNAVVVLVVFFLAGRLLLGFFGIFLGVSVDHKLPDFDERIRVSAPPIEMSDGDRYPTHS